MDFGLNVAALFAMNGDAEVNPRIDKREIDDATFILNSSIDNCKKISPIHYENNDYKLRLVQTIILDQFFFTYK